MHLVKSTKIIVAGVALALTAATVAFAYGASQGQPTLVVHGASDLLGGASPEPTPPAEKAPAPRPQKTTFTTSYPERAAQPRAAAPAAEPSGPAARPTQKSPRPRATADPRPSRAAPSPAPSPSQTPTPLEWLVSTLTSGL